MSDGGCSISAPDPRPPCVTYGYGLSLVGGANATFAAKAAVVTASGAASGATRGGISAARLGRSGGPLGELSGGNFMVRTAIAAAAGGTAAEIGGGSFENGAISAAYTYMFNHAAEKGAEIWITRMAKTEAGYGLIDGIQDGLSVLGLVPFAGDVVDGINALIYLARGQHAEAAMSAAAMVPFGGIVSTGLRLSKRVGKVIGRVKDLKKLGPGEKSLLHRLTPDLGSPKANWKRNSGVLRQEMNRGQPIRDASIGDNTGPFLNAERNLLQDRGWKLEGGYWNPPQ